MGRPESSGRRVTAHITALDGASQTGSAMWEPGSYGCRKRRRSRVLSLLRALCGSRDEAADGGVDLPVCGSRNE